MHEDGGHTLIILHIWRIIVRIEQHQSRIQLEAIEAASSAPVNNSES